MAQILFCLLMNYHLSTAVLYALTTALRASMALVMLWWTPLLFGVRFAGRRCHQRSDFCDCQVVCKDEWPLAAAKAILADDGKYFVRDPIVVPAQIVGARAVLPSRSNKFVVLNYTGV